MSLHIHDMLTTSIEQGLHTVVTWERGGVASMDQAWLTTLDEGVNLSVDGLTCIRPSFTACPSTIVVDTMRKTTSHSIVAGGEDVASSIREDTTH